MALVQTDRDPRGVLTVTLDDPDRRNALSRDLLVELVDVLDAADDDPEVRVVVLTNTGTTFCAGANLAEQSAPSGGRTVEMAEVFGRFRRSPKPYVGRLAGHCVAGGMGLAAAMDLSVGLVDAKFGFTEVRIGVAPAMISVLCLPKLREADARAAFLRGRRFTGAEAAEMGIINEAVAPDELDAAVEAIVADLLLAGPGALAASKRLLAEVPAMAVDDAFAWTQQLSSELFRSDEAREGMAAFLEKRRPPWAPVT
jgi:methylglutaconyl-CoA hydratase